PAMPLPAGLNRGEPLAATSLAVGYSDRVIGYARLPGSAVRFLRIDLPTSALTAQRRALRLLAPVTLGASAAALLLVIFFARHAFAPYDALLARARAAGAVSESDDEISALVS